MNGQHGVQRSTSEPTPLPSFHRTVIIQDPSQKSQISHLPEEQDQKAFDEKNTPTPVDTPYRATSLIVAAISARTHSYELSAQFAGESATVIVALAGIHEIHDQATLVRLVGLIVLDVIDLTALVVLLAVRVRLTFILGDAGLKRAA